MCNWVRQVREREKKEKRKWDRILTPAGRLKKRRGYSTWEVPSLAGRSAKMEGELRGCQRKVQLTVCGGQDRVRPTQTVHDSPACPSLGWGSISAGRGRVPEQRVSRAGLGRGLLLAVQRWPEGMGVRNSATRNAPQRSLDGHSTESALLSDAQRVRSQSQPLSTLQPLPLQARGGALPRASSPAPVPATFLPSPQSEHVCPRQLRSYKKCLTRT